jgi:hypothetical protein
LKSNQFYTPPLLSLILSPRKTLVQDLTIFSNSSITPKIPSEISVIQKLCFHNESRMSPLLDQLERNQGIKRKNCMLDCDDEVVLKRLRVRGLKMSMSML